jgi:hypothetical protein
VLMHRITTLQPVAWPGRVLRLRLGKRIESINIGRLVSAQDDGFFRECISQRSLSGWQKATGSVGGAVPFCMRERKEAQLPRQARSQVQLGSEKNAEQRPEVERVIEGQASTVETSVAGRTASRRNGYLQHPAFAADCLRTSLDEIYARIRAFCYQQVR